MGVQIVAYEADERSLRVVHLKQLPDFVRPVNAGSVFTHTDMAPASEGFDKHENISGPIAFVFIVHTLGASRGCRQRPPRFLDELTRLFIHTHQRNIGVVRQTVQVQNILHPCHELPVLFRRNTPVGTQVGFQLVFFGALRTVS